MPRYKKITILAEKPKAAEKIAMALSELGLLDKLSYRGLKYYKIKKDSDIIYVTYALGHLYTLEEVKPKFFKRYPIFTLNWTLEKRHNKKSSIKKIVALLDKLSKESDEIVNACDYDIEGSTLGFNAIRFAKKKDGAKVSRMKFSSLTKKELISSFFNRDIKLDGYYATAGISRHLIDFIWGVNLTRLLTDLAFSASGVHSLISIGRVQGPTLYYIVKREREIGTFVPLPFWNLKGRFKTKNGELIEAIYVDNPVLKKVEVEKIEKEIEKQAFGIVDNIKKGSKRYAPPPPFNLTNLQSEAYTNFGFKPSRTLAIAEQLYLEALITYPRTSSQKYPADIDHREILNNLSKINGYEKFIKKIYSINPELKPVQGKKEDPAHPAIFPTGETPKRELSSAEKKLYDLILRRYLSSFYKPIKMETMRVSIKAGDYIFILNGRRISDRGWLDVYEPYTNIGESTLPLLNEGDKLKIIELIVEDKYTSPPRRYTQRSLLLQMEKDGIGTKATRSQVIDTLYQRNYIKGESIEPTELGMTLIEILEKKIPNIISLDMTREMEKNLEEILVKPTLYKKVLKDSVEKVLDIILTVMSEGELGKELDSMSKTTRYRKRVLGKCPVCQEGDLIVIVSKRTGKRFVGCSNYPKCTASMPLPQKGKIRPGGVCNECNWPKIKVTIKYKTFVSCVNLNCPTREKVKQKNVK
jgi:DNA topoisomerase-1